jgi:hypothetical protein
LEEETKSEENTSQRYIGVAIVTFLALFLFFWPGEMVYSNGRYSLEVTFFPRIVLGVGSLITAYSILRPQDIFVETVGNGVLLTGALLLFIF